MTIHKLHSYIHLDSINKCYKKIIIVNNKPSDTHFSNIIKTIARKKNSKYQDIYCCDRPPHCVHTILNPNNTNEYLGIDDIDVLLSYLIEGGYQIETHLTEVFIRSKVYKESNLICVISKN